MAENSKIEWTDHTFNPWEGCQKVGPGCDNCYAEARNLRFNKGQAINWGPGAPRRRTSEANWKLPGKWNAQAEREGRRFRVFCSSLADVFDNAVPAEWRAHLFCLIAATPNLDWLLLTKRIGNARAMIAEATATVEHYNPGIKPWTSAEPWPNVWIGATVVNQEEADRDIPKLLALPARVRFLSIEPMLGPIDLRRIDINGSSEIYPLTGTTGCEDDDGEPAPDIPALDWVICGGESGPKARPMHPDWARSLRDQCAAAGVPFLFKQWGEWLPGQNEFHPGEKRRIAHHQDGRWGATGTKVHSGNYIVWEESGEVHRGDLTRAPLSMRAHAWAERVGKQAAGRLLDGVEHNGFPS